MKRILLLILVIGVLLLGACGAPTTVPEAETPPATPPAEQPTPTTYTLSVSVSPSGAGSVSPSDGEYEEGTQVTLTATPASGYTFGFWGGGASGSSSTIIITMDSDKKITAAFRRISYDLAINIVGNGTTSPEAGVHSYPEGTMVELRAAPGESWEFSGWNGDITDTSATTQITMDSDKNIIAHFADTTPPVISGVDISGITETIATITWTTDEPATSHVEYGKTTNYGLTTTLDKELATSHSVTLTELKPETTYHFRIKSVDEAGNEALSDDYTFTTKTTKELLSAMLYPGITIGGRVHQLSFNLFNGSSQTITVTKVEIFDEQGDVAFTMSKSDIAETWGSGEVDAGKSLSAGISFGIPPTTEEIEGWQVKWYCIDADGQRFTVKGLARKL